MNISNSFSANVLLNGGPTSHQNKWDELKPFQANHEEDQKFGEALPDRQGKLNRE